MSGLEPGPAVLIELSPALTVERWLALGGKPLVLSFDPAASRLRHVIATDGEPVVRRFWFVEVLDRLDYGLFEESDPLIELADMLAKAGNQAPLNVELVGSPDDLMAALNRCAPLNLRFEDGDRASLLNDAMSAAQALRRISDTLGWDCGDLNDEPIVRQPPIAPSKSQTRAPDLLVEAEYHLTARRAEALERPATLLVVGLFEEAQSGRRLRGLPCYDLPIVELIEQLIFKAGDNGSTDRFWALASGHPRATGRRPVVEIVGSADDLFARFDVVHRRLSPGLFEKWRSAIDAGEVVSLAHAALAKFDMEIYWGDA